MARPFILCAPTCIRPVRAHVATAGMLLLLAIGGACSPTDKEGSAVDATDPSAPDNARPARPLRVAVVDGPELGQAIEREWQASSQESIELQIVSAAQLSAEPLHADVVIFPPAMLGQAVTARQIVPWPVAASPGEATSHSLAETPAYDWNDVFPWLRRRELRWGKTLYGVSFGSPQLLLLYRQDLLSRWKLSPPETWAEYAQLVSKLAEHISQTPETDLRYATLEPLVDGWATRTLLARAAAYARHPNQYSTLFQFNTMRPLIDQPPFVRALQEMVTALADLPEETHNQSPDQLAESLVAGETVMAITWPSAARRSDVDAESGAIFAIRPLPGASEVYQVSNRSWQQRDGNEPQTVPVLGCSGMMGSIARRARSLENASHFLIWLTGTETSRRVSTECTQTTLFRQTQTTFPRAWVESTLR